MAGTFQTSTTYNGLALGDMSPQDWQNYLDKQNLFNSRVQQLTANDTIGKSSNSTSDSSNSNSSNSSTGTSLFGDLSNATNTAKDLATFNQGLTQQQGQFDLGLREQEAQSNFGRTKELNDQNFGYNYKLGDQQITGQKDITNLQQNATTDRLQRQLDVQQNMQKSGFDQQNLYRAQSAALALRGLK